MGIELAGTFESEVFNVEVFNSGKAWALSVTKTSQKFSTSFYLLPSIPETCQKIRCRTSFSPMTDEW
ncbi:hypothetical protein QT970_06445 [Microcoleus sp. herbarium8]|uniref:hypothetical protein n=1 Tax=Microcoleus sp. herbarium8 TaxID=3055436 RepID=UPI002FCF2F83